MNAHIVYRKKGFTLIELLVVIAIIALLSSIVLTSLTSAREKGNDATIKQNLTNMRTSAQLFYESVGRYGSLTGTYYEGDCITASTMFRETLITGEARTVADGITSSIAKSVALGRGGKTCRTDANRTAYLIAVQLKSSNNYWCIDNRGTSVEITAQPATGVLVCQ